MSVLKDTVFGNKDKIEHETLKKHRIKSLENIGQDIAEYLSWYMARPVATVSLIIKDGEIDQCVAMVLGDSDPKRVDAKLIFGEDYKVDDHQI